MASSLALGICLSGAASVGDAQILSAGEDTFQAPADARWKTITARDVRAAYQLLRDNHPGAAPELHDTAFVSRLTSAYGVALSRAAQVDSYQGYQSVLAGFAVSMGDKHIWSRPTFVVNSPRWPEFIVARRGSSWVVSDTEESQSALKGAQLIGCDGEPVEDMARTRLGGFRAQWSIGAQQFQSAPWLLVDEGNPFIKRPGSCVLEQDGRRHEVTLNWLRIKRESLLPRLKAAGGAGAAGYGVRKVGDGYWIALQDLDTDKALNVVKSVEQQKASLRAARFVVLDLRGNGGGDSDLGRQIARSLLGEPAVTARLGLVIASACGSAEVYRASPGNLAQLEYLRRAPFVAPGGSDVQKYFNDMISQVRTAIAQGHNFSGPVECPPPARPTPVALPPSQLQGRLILITDNLCFSSCLAVTDDFRQLGALHTGQTTDAATRYVDVREQYLPSGYSMFSTLQAVSGDSPQVGPFEPAMAYEGDIADTEALETWVIRTVVPTR